jgi:hypothetical protein
VRDEGKRATTPAAATRRRVSTRMALLVLLTCSLIGYGLSFVLPLHTTPRITSAERGPQKAHPATAAPVTKAAPSPAAAVTGPAGDVVIEARAAKPPSVASDVTPASLPIGQNVKTAARDAAPEETTARVVEPEPAALPLTPSAGVETGSPTPPVAATAARRAEPARSRAHARELRRKRIARAYARRRPAPSPPVGPVQALFGWMTK